MNLERSAAGRGLRNRREAAVYRKKGSTNLLLVDHFDSYLASIGANFRDVHRVAENRERVERTRSFSPHFIAQLPDALRKVIDEERDFAITQLLIDPPRPAGEIRRGSEVE